MNNKLLLLIGAGLVWYFISGDDSVITGPGVYASEQPKQTQLVNKGGITQGEYQITPLQAFALKAKVLSKKDYRLGSEADISPTDLALGWGRMSDESVLASFDISQRNRWYYWRADEMPIPRKEVISSSANMHIIPANSDVEWQLEKVRKGDVVQLRGSLVRVDAQDGWHWVSSLSRNDTGGGSCELFLVESLSIVTI